ncbi:hypothetical protein L4C32_02260 [Aliivibrio kagoshimensis]
MIRLIVPLLIITFLPFFGIANAETSSTAPQNDSIATITQKPLVERYILDELKSVRHDLQDLERRLVVEITDRELELADKSLGYASLTVNYFFYIIAGFASLMAVVGWQSLKEIRTSTTKMAEQQLQNISKQYEDKFKALERDLKKKTRVISDNNKQIEIINEIHNLWIRAQGSQTAEQRMAVYDEILKIRPGDLEALTHKADAAMEIKEYHWALSLCNRVLKVDDTNAHAFYQRACAYACLGLESQAIDDLELALSNSGSFRELVAEEADFENLKGHQRFEDIIASLELQRN